jgi:P27 family predicted phage terminase small subunit
MPPRAVVVWHEIVSSNDLAGRVDRAALEAFCSIVARMREAQERVEEEGLVVSDARGRVVAHPALAIERAAAEQIRAWGDRFAPFVKPTRQRGYMADATAKSIGDAPHLAEAKYAGPVAAVKTLAWLIDECQRAGMDALQKATYNLIPTYLKACAELQITPASSAAGAPAPAAKGATTGGKVTKFADAAAARRQRQGSTG